MQEVSLGIDAYAGTRSFDFALADSTQDEASFSPRSPHPTSS
jgi:hypothetical protein